MERLLTYNNKILSSNNKIVQLGLDSDALAFIQAIGITNSDQINAIYYLVKELKNVSLWNKMKAIYPFIGGTATTHKFNLKDPRDLDIAFRLTFTATTHTSNGVVGDGSTGKIMTYIYGDTNLTHNDIHYSYYSRTSSSANAKKTIDIGFDNEDIKYFELIIQNKNDLNMCQSALDYSGTRNGLIQFINSDAKGLYIASRVSSSINKIYKNSLLMGSNNGNINTPVLPHYPVTLFATSAGTNNILQCAFASIGYGLTDTDALNLYNIVNQYQILLSRNV